MRKLFISMIVLLLSVVVYAQETIIPISTNDNLMLLQTSRDGRLNTMYFGEPLENETEHAAVARGTIPP